MGDVMRRLLNRSIPGALGVLLIAALAGCYSGVPANDETDPLPTVFGNKEVDVRQRGTGGGGGGGGGRGTGGGRHHHEPEVVHGSKQGPGTGGGKRDAAGERAPKRDAHPKSEPQPEKPADDVTKPPQESKPAEPAESGAREAENRS